MHHTITIDPFVVTVFEEWNNPFPGKGYVPTHPPQPPKALFTFEITGHQVDITNMLTGQKEQDFGADKDELIEVILVVLEDAGCLPPGLEADLEKQLPDFEEEEFLEIDYDWDDLPSFTP